MIQLPGVCHYPALWVTHPTLQQCIPVASFPFTSGLNHSAPVYKCAAGWHFFLLLTLHRFRVYIPWKDILFSQYVLPGGVGRMHCPSYIYNLPWTCYTEATFFMWCPEEAHKVHWADFFPFVFREVRHLLCWLEQSHNRDLCFYLLLYSHMVFMLLHILRKGFIIKQLTGPCCQLSTCGFNYRTDRWK